MPSKGTSIPQSLPSHGPTEADDFASERVFVARPFDLSAGEGMPSAKSAVILISRSLGFSGKTQSLSVELVIQQYGEAARDVVASNSRVSAPNARRLGWSPKGPSLADVIGRGAASHVDLRDQSLRS
jgi:hypothetical protein